LHAVRAVINKDKLTTRDDVTHAERHKFSRFVASSGHLFFFILNERDLLAFK